MPNSNGQSTIDWGPFISLVDTDVASASDGEVVFSDNPQYTAWSMANSRRTPGSSMANKPMKDEQGFTLVPLRRGITEVSFLLNMFKECYSKTGQKCFIAGGFARWCASPHQDPVPPGDVDIYCEGKSAFDYMNRMLVLKCGFGNTSRVAVSYARPTDVGNPFTFIPQVQLIKPQKKGLLVATGNLKEIIGHFDFSVIRVGIQDNKWALADIWFTQDELSRELRIQQIQCPVSSFGRCLKYAKKGYYLPPHETLGLLADWESRPKKYKTKLSKLLAKMKDGGRLTKDENILMYELMIMD